MRGGVNDVCRFVPWPKLLRQQKPGTCGQTCVAMLLGIKLDEAVELIGHDGITSDDEIKNALGLTGDFVNGKPTSDCIALQKHRDPANAEREHWTVSRYGETLDPACIGRKLWPVRKHIHISWWNMTAKVPTPPPKRICPFCCRELGEPEVNSRGVVVKDCSCGWIRPTSPAPPKR